MTFVIKDEIEKKNKDLIGNFFDVEPYNYVRNKSTSFLDGSFVKNNYRELKSVRALAQVMINQRSEIE